MNIAQRDGSAGARILAAPADDQSLVEALRSGDEAAFSALLDQYHTAMLSLATFYVSSRAVAEEVVQETWMGVLQGIERFEGRSSLKTWIFRILSNRARTRGEREDRYVPFSAFSRTVGDAFHTSPEPAEHSALRHGWWSHQWASPQHTRRTTPEECVLTQEMCACIQEVIATLPPNQRSVITLRDIEGWTAEEVCDVLAVSEANQRVLLHRARLKVRRRLEQFFAEG